MRALLWILLLGSVCGGLLLLFSEDSERGNNGALLDQGGDGGVPLDDGEARLLRSEVQEVILIEGPNEWPRDLMLDGEAFSDPGALDEIEIVSPTGKDYGMTGAEFLVVLERVLAGTGYQFRFKDEQTRETFKECEFKGPIPPNAPLRLLFDQAMFSGFRFVTYAGNIYITPAKEGEIPGAGEVPAVPIEEIDPGSPQGG